ncbi:MAG: NAD(P)H-hydrate dehydratase [Gammaproteobacteria bacterium]|nr:NAD(P)H-hydrate dehydratase [Gammaproteobacteria bacterium]
MPALPTALYTAAQVRALDRHAIEVLGVPGYELMNRAAQAALVALRARFPTARRLRIWCGAGNNAGDGYVLARLAQAAGLAVEVVAVTAPERLAGDAATAWRDWCAASPERLSHAAPAASDGVVNVDLEVDALLGTGLDRPVEGAMAAAVRQINDSPAPVVALDIPSGLSADSGAALGVAVQADLTVSFVALKQGLLTGAGPAHAGALVFDDLGVDAAGAGVAPSMRRLVAGDLLSWLPGRSRDAHKGRHGRVLVIGGGPGMPGAVRLAAEAALRVGAGLVSVASLPAHVPAVVAARPEIICHGIEADAAGFALLDELLANADVVALGPGLGRSEWARALWQRAMRHAGPMVIDADGLNLLAEQPLAAAGPRVLTPHPGEAARLLGTTPAAIQADRPAALQALVARHGGIVVLKGAGSLIARNGECPWLCDRGNPGMASAGTGDVLTGAIAGLIAQLGCAWTGARAGVLVHALAGDAAAAGGERGLLAGDLLMRLRACVNP